MQTNSDDHNFIAEKTACKSVITQFYETSPFTQTLQASNMKRRKLKTQKIKPNTMKKHRHATCIY
jgi:hypothetical protein